MIKLIDILAELKVKDKWVPFSSSEIDDIKKELFGLVKTAYASIGGHANIKGPNDLKDEGDNFDVIDLDSDPDIDAVSISKNKPPFGKKFTATGHDGSQVAKSSVVKHKVDLLKKKGYYIEASGKMQDVLLGKGLRPIADEDLVRKILKGKEITWNGDGSYMRRIGADNHVKMMFGRPNV